MENKNILRYVSAGCFGACVLIYVYDLVQTIISSSGYGLPMGYTLMYFVVPIISFTLIAVAIVLSNPMLLACGGAVAILTNLYNLVTNLRFYDGMPQFIGTLLRNFTMIGAMVMIILIAFKGDKFGKILGIIGGGLIASNRASIMITNQIAYGGGMSYSFSFYFYAALLIAGIVLLGLTCDSVPFSVDAPQRTAGQYAAGQPSRPLRQYRRYNASAPGGGAAPQNNPASGNYPPQNNPASGNYPPNNEAANYYGPNNAASSRNDNGANGNGPMNTPQGQIDELSRLKGLLDSGVITKEEFEAMKKKLIGM